MTDTIRVKSIAAGNEYDVRIDHIMSASPMKKEYGNVKIDLIPKFVHYYDPDADIDGPEFSVLSSDDVIFEQFSKDHGFTVLTISQMHQSGYSVNTKIAVNTDKVIRIESDSSLWFDGDSDSGKPGAVWVEESVPVILKRLGCDEYEVRPIFEEAVANDNEPAEVPQVTQGSEEHRL